ncbi:hypothetical protein H1C71_014748, partial [Ictidomys tridecemlineatus]
TSLLPPFPPPPFHLPPSDHPVPHLTFPPRSPRPSLPPPALRVAGSSRVPVYRELGGLGLRGSGSRIPTEKLAQGSSGGHFPSRRGCAPPPCGGSSSGSPSRLRASSEGDLKLQPRTLPAAPLARLIWRTLLLLKFSTDRKGSNAFYFGSEKGGRKKD